MIATLISRRKMNNSHISLALVACFVLCCSVSGHSDQQPVDEITLEREQIFVNIQNGTTFSLMMDPERDSVRDLWEDINESEGMHGRRMHLLLGDTWLNYDAKLSEYNIRANSTVTLVIAEDQGRYPRRFSVRSSDGRELQVATPLGITVASLKESIAKWTGISQAQQRLLLEGKELEDERKLVHYGIHYGTTIELGTPLEDCRRVVTLFIKTLRGTTLELAIDLAETVDGLKKKIWEMTGVPVGVQRLFSNERLITGRDHLCDLGLQANSTIYMLLHSSRITSLDQVASLREPPVASPVAFELAPIFREAEDAREQVSHQRRASIFKDTRNWLVQIGSRPTWDSDLFDPVAYLAPNPDIEVAIEGTRESLGRYSLPEATESDRVDASIIRAQIKLSSAVRKYRVAANLTAASRPSPQPGISLAGGFATAATGSLERPIPLGADINNWAPDAFSDADAMRLFEVSERARQVLARNDEGTLSIASQRRINRAILNAHIEALAGYPPASEYDRPSENEECGICRDDLAGELAVKLACEHTFHADCVLSWAASSCPERNVPSCPFCRQKFIFSYGVLGRVELDKPEMQVHRGE